MTIKFNLKEIGFLIALASDIDEVDYYEDEIKAVIFKARAFQFGGEEKFKVVNS